MKLWIVIGIVGLAAIGYLIYKAKDVGAEKDKVLKEPTPTVDTVAEKVAARGAAVAPVLPSTKAIDARGAPPYLQDILDAIARAEETGTPQAIKPATAGDTEVAYVSPTMAKAGAPVPGTEAPPDPGAYLQLQADLQRDYEALTGKTYIGPVQYSRTPLGTIQATFGDVPGAIYYDAGSPLPEASGASEVENTYEPAAAAPTASAPASSSVSVESPTEPSSTPDPEPETVSAVLDDWYADF